FYSKGLARLEGRWAGSGVSGLEYLDFEHPYAADLDLFGVGSLFERLCTARTRSGEERLSSWLLAPATPETIHERHVAISELRPRLDLREDLELLGVEVREGIDPSALAAWSTAQREFPGRGVLVIATLLGALGTVTLIGWAFFDWPLLPLLAVLLIVAAFSRWMSKPVSNVLAAVDQRVHDLVLLAELLRRLEREPFEAPLLRRLVTALETDGHPASSQIKTLARLIQVLDWKRNQLFLPLALLWLWTIQLALRIDAWRSRSGRAITGWLAAVGEFEALCALAAYAAENPADPFPDLAPGPACFEAESLGHPLILHRECVRNDVSLGPVTRVYLVSGSNMSGKSTLLRTVGINAVLAQAGAPVRAVRLRLSPLAVGGTLRIQDSLQAGRSRFYAEITRVRQLVDLSRGPLPLLFLLDELFHGTNSHDRCVGAESVVRGLIDRGAIGLVTTHDLSLARIVDNLAPTAINVHFEDHLEDGKMSFDYRMRPGVVQHSNALALMRAIGLEV
ncbi:MAG TPA: DNA mismatch repair protein MutS, partial [Isosphaeraceae bacterium]|nr:DNA mismatch repair protein MutS [Isosphaeraceae bacterium]